MVTFSDKNYQPDGSTPMYDAICESVLRLKRELVGIDDYGVLVTIITDGQENSSKEFTKKETKLLIDDMSKDSKWGFGLIGANIDLEETAGSLSIPLSRAMKFEHSNLGVKAMFNRYSTAQVLFCESFKKGRDFNDDISF